MRHYGSTPVKSIGLMLFALVWAGCGGDKTTTTPDPNGTTPPLSATVTVSDNAFSPSSVTILRTGTVTWNWTAGPHNVTFSDENSGNKLAGGTYSKAFPNAGTFDYSCTVHPGMAGSVVVQ